jgi:hypothetical protein
MPRSLSAVVIASSVVALVLRIASMTGKETARELVGGADLDLPTAHPAAAMFERLPSTALLAFLRRQGRLRPL